MTQLSLVPEPDGSPFDKIRRHVGDHEWWSARDLMPLLGYEKWERFEDAIDRARTASEVMGHDTDQAFSRRRENGQSGGARVEYHLSRFACYLIAMNGDSRKHQIAAAMTYFAVKTREAEVAHPPRELTRREMAMAVIEAEDAREAAERELAAAMPAIEQHAQFLDTTGSMPIAVVAKALNVGPNRLFAFLRRHRVLISTAGPRFNTPYQDQVETGRFEIVMGTRERTDGSSEPTYTTRCTAKGQAHIHKLIETHGRP